MMSKNEYLDLSFHAIQLTFQECYLFGKIYECLKIPESAPCAANFRDSFFHFKRLYESDFEEEMLAQYESIIEHINRLFKDSIVRLTQILDSSLAELMKGINDKKTYMQLYDYTINLKWIQLKLRANALEIIRLIDNQEEVISIFNTMKEIILFLKSNELFDKFLACNAQCT